MVGCESEEEGVLLLYRIPEWRGRNVREEKRESTVQLCLVSKRSRESGKEGGGGRGNRTVRKRLGLGSFERFEGELAIPLRGRNDGISG
jgi:hypothetical protein